MKQSNINHAPEITAPDDEQVGLVDLLIVFAKRKRLILGVPVAMGVICAAISFILPPVYKANTKILPPQQSQQTGAAALLAQLGGAGGMAAGVAGLKNPNDLYIGMLKSRTVADRLIGKFNLKDVYETESVEKARKILDAKTAIVSGKDGLISIDVEDESAKRSADMAEAYSAELVRLTRDFAVTEASQRRLFFSNQLQLAKDNLAKAEAASRGAIDASGLISIEGESRGVVETVARLRAQISAKEIQLNSMKAFVTTDHPESRRVQEELSSLRQQLDGLEHGDGTQAGNASNNQSPSGLKSIQLLRDVKYYQMLYELLSKQYEVARLDEAKDGSVVQILDHAVVPEKRFKPQRSLIVLGGMVAGFFIAIFWALISEAKQRAMQRPEFAQSWSVFKHELAWRKRP
jgi:tyrosine-protein kinase Etk/Wzc